MIPFTKPFLPSREKFDLYLDEIWKSHWLTNQGPLLSKLESEMASFLGVAHISFVSSGTMGLQLALRTLEKKGSIITTPFSYVATTTSIIWEGHEAVFADIQPDTLNIDPQQVEELITKDTVAILATHIFGNTCDTEALDTISQKHNIPIIYDAAHCFGSMHQGKSLTSFGDFSVLSTHATKLFHTANGGFVISKTVEGKQLIDRLKNFGHDGQNNFEGLGINGKNSEMHAALGLSSLIYAKELVAQRRAQWNYYQKALAQTNVNLLTLNNPEGFNGAYFPIICQSSQVGDQMMLTAKKQDIELRRYFYPSLDQLSYVNSANMPNSNRVAERVLCLPMYHSMSQYEQDRVIQLVQNSVT